MNNENTKQTAEVAVEVLEALGTAAVVVNAVNVMEQATTVAENFGLQRYKVFSIGKIFMEFLLFLIR